MSYPSSRDEEVNLVWFGFGWVWVGYFPEGLAIDLAGLEICVFLPQFPKYRDYRCIPSCLAANGICELVDLGNK